MNGPASILGFCGHWPRAGALAVIVMALAGCALTTPPTHEAIVADALPKNTRIAPAWVADPATGEVANDWLKSFQDPTLDALVAEALANNPDLREAATKVEIAQQAVIVVGARLLPQVGVQIGGTALYDWDHNGNYTSTVGYVGVAWELDVWGRLRAQRAAAEASAEAVALDYAYARQSLAATTAMLWFLATESRQLLALSEESVRIYGQLYQLVLQRRNAGKDSDLDVVDVRAKLETAQSEVVAARQAYGEVRRALEVLLGRYPAAEVEAAPTYPPLPAPVTAGLPSSLLERRPDIVAAERAVLSAFRRQEAAKLALLPDFSLSFAGGRVGDNVLSLLRLNPWLASVGIGMSIPIYEGGALQAKVVIATAEQADAVARYGSIALAAFREVENSLASEQAIMQRIPLGEKALADRTEAVRISLVQYKAGRIDLLWVAQLQTVQIANQEIVIKLRGAQRLNRVRLHQALGGSFERAPAVALEK